MKYYLIPDIELHISTIVAIIKDKIYIKIKKIIFKISRINFPAITPG